MKSIEVKLEIISSRVNAISGIPLFAELPVSELETLNKKIFDEDSISIGINSLCNLLDRINKKELDKYNGIGKSNGSRDSLIRYLKKILPSNHNKIDEYIDKPLGMILLLRGYFIHKRNNNIRKAEEYFLIKFPVNNYSDLWSKVLYQFNTSLDVIKELLDEKENTVLKQQENINDEITTLLSANYVTKYDHRLKESSVKKILLYLYTEEESMDYDIAKEFRYDIEELRELLLPFIPSLLYPKYIDLKSTLVCLTTFGKSLVENLYLNNKK